MRPAHVASAAIWHTCKSKRETVEICALMKKVVRRNKVQPTTTEYC